MDNLALENNNFDKKSEVSRASKDNINISFSTDLSNKNNRLRTERHNILGTILGTEMRIKSNQITINSVDKSTFKKSECSKLDTTNDLIHK
jgi:hypothetical protein